MKLPTASIPWAWLWLCATAPALAQNAAPAAPADSAASAPQRIDITGQRAGETEQRRQSTAAKIVVGRDEIEAFGDSSVGEVLRRLPGVTTPGRPGRGGAPRLRGLGSGYTQLLIDGEPIPRGFSLESLAPDQVERIEILRAPTAETGARAIAGTINIILREGYRKRLNDLRPSLGVEDGRVSPGLFWVRNDQADALSYNLTAGAFERRTHDRSTTTTRRVELDSGDELSSSEERLSQDNLRRGLNLSARLQWRLGEPGDLLTLTPSVFHADNTGRAGSTLARQGEVEDDPGYDRAETGSESRFSVARLNGQWRQRLTPDLRAELGGTASHWRSAAASQRDESLAGVPQRRLDDRAHNREDKLVLNGKLSSLLGGDDSRPGSEHSLVAGGELEALRRREARSLVQDGAPLLADFGDNLQAASTRLALYAQDEWSPTRQWSLHAGLRWEGIETEGDLGDGTRPQNRNSVWTPLAHAVWKPEPASRSQLRMSLTRSWRAPPLNALIARPSPNTRYPVDGPNTATHPDRAGNPGLQPELAGGIDLALEHYPAGGGVFSASVFQRRIRDLMRSVTTLEDVSWSAVPRWVARTQNVGDAVTQGLELEAKGRLDQWRPDAPRLDLRSSLSVYHSRVDGVPGSDNRLDEQPRGNANLGADYKWPQLPVKLGGNLSWVPAYQTQLDADQRVGVSTRRVFDLYALWTINPTAALRLQAANLGPQDSDDFRQVASDGVLETARTVAPSSVNWQLRLELKL